METSTGMKRPFQLQFNNYLESTPKCPRLLKPNTRVLPAKIPFQDVTNTSENVSITFDKYFESGKENISALEPLTPSSNIKLLTSVAANSKYLSSDTQNLTSPVSNSENENDEAKLKVSRKSKSLGLLCKRFFALYPDYPGENKIIICLDQTAESLGVEKRRVYDIVNVLESVDLLRKVGKNTYRWFGKGNLTSSVTKLKNEAQKENFEDKIKRAISNERTQSFRKMKSGDSFAAAEEDSTSPDNMAFFEDDSLIICDDFSDAIGYESKKEKSLSGMSRKFLMLCLASAPKSISLELAAQIIADSSVDKTEIVQFKTKVRRLYDIANVLMSVNLVQKVYVPGVRGRKPAFQYIGPDPSDSSKFSDSKPKFMKAKSADFDTHPSSKSQSNKGNLRRNVSFQDICEAAEIERKKLYASNTAKESNKSSSDNSQEFTKDISQLSPKEAGTKKCCESSPLITENAAIFQTESVGNAHTLHKVIKLTSEQMASILNVINISLDVNQVASIQLYGSSSESQSSVSLVPTKENIGKVSPAGHNVSDEVSIKTKGDSLLNAPVGQVVIYYPNKASPIDMSSLLKPPSQVSVNKNSPSSAMPLTVPIPLNSEKICLSSLKNSNSLSSHNKSNKGSMNPLFVKDSLLQSENSTSQSPSSPLLSVCSLDSIENFSPMGFRTVSSKSSSEPILSESSSRNAKLSDVQCCAGESSNSEVESILENENPVSSDCQPYLFDEKTVCSPVVKSTHSSQHVSLTSPVKLTANVCSSINKTVPVFSHKLRTNSDLKVGDFIQISPKSLSPPGYATPSRNFVISHLLQLPSMSLTPPSSANSNEFSSSKDLTVVTLQPKAE